MSRVQKKKNFLPYKITNSTWAAFDSWEKLLNYANSRYSSSWQHLRKLINSFEFWDQGSQKMDENEIII